jgi:hypothetical protein
MSEDHEPGYGEIENFIPSYPSIKDPSFSKEIASKKEFARYALVPGEEVKAGELLHAQEFMREFFSPHTPYTKALLAHGMGTGKCVHKSTVISTTLGDKTIEELWREHRSSRVMVDDSPEQGEWSNPKDILIVWSYSEDSKCFTPGVVTNLYRQYIEEYLLEITLEDSSSITITEKHHLFDGKVWYLPRKIGDIVAVPTWSSDGFSPIAKYRREFPVSMQEDTIGLKIVSIKYVPCRDYVYDLEVSVYHNYVANDVLCHNTCIISAVEEMHKNTLVAGERRERCLLLVKNDGLKKKFFDAVANVCTKGVYKGKYKLKELESGAEFTKEEKLKRIYREIATNYEVVTFETFLKKVGSSESIRRRYSNRLIVIDEAHAIRIQPRSKATEASKASAAEGKKSKKEKSSKEATLYDELWNFLQSVENSRILLLTGTPIWDQTSEIASLMNLILPKTEQLPTGAKFTKRYFDEKGVLIPEKVHELRKAFHGRVSFLRTDLTSARRIEMGIVDPYTKYRKIYPVAMSDFQARYAKEAAEKEERSSKYIRGKKVERITKGGEIYKLAKDAMNMVVPIIKDGVVVGGEYGPSAMSHVAEKIATGKIGEAKTGTKTAYKLKPALAKEFKKNLARYSAKFAHIIREIKAHPDEVVFVYDEVVSSSVGGVTMFKLCLENEGLLQVRKASRIPVNASATDRRFVVLAGSGVDAASSEETKKILEESNKPSNAYAGRLQVIIGSRKIATGYDIKYARQVHKVSPNWNIPSEAQAEARAFRFKGHDALKPEERFVKVYSYAAVEAGKKDDIAKGKAIEFEGQVLSTKPTIDIEIFRVAEEKEHRNTQIYRLLKEESFDCGITYERNVLENDVDGTRDCDYQKCNYECSGFKPNKTYLDGTKRKVWNYSIPLEKQDQSTYNLFYSEPEIQVYISKLLELFTRHFSLHIDSVYALLDVPDTKKEKTILLMALERAITRRIPVRNQYGFYCYIKEQGNIVFLDSEISPIASYAESTYLKFPLVHQTRSMSNIVEMMLMDKDRPLVDKFCNDPTAENFAALSHISRVVLFETAFAQSKTSEGLKSPAGKFALDRFKNDVFDVDGAILHVLYTEEYKGTAYNISAKDIPVKGLTRQFIPGKKALGRWVNVTDPKIEKEYTIKIKDIKTTKHQDPYDLDPLRRGIFGWISKDDGKFRVEIKKEVKRGGPGKKGLTKGMVCKSFKLPVLFDIFVNRIKYLPPINPAYEDLDHNALVKLIRGRQNIADLREMDQDGNPQPVDFASKTNEELRGLLTLFSMKNEGVCAILQEWLSNEGLLLNL